MDQFAARVDRGGRRRGTCNPCRQEAHAEAVKAHPEWKRGRTSPVDPEARAGYVRKYNHGISEQEYQALLEAQGGTCAICQQPCSTGRRLAVDHDHRCCPGKRSCGQCVRGLLCMKCNAGLGHLNDDASLLARALDYLIEREQHA